MRRSQPSSAGRNRGLVLACGVAVAIVLGSLPKDVRAADAGPTGTGHLRAVAAEDVPRGTRIALETDSDLAGNVDDALYGAAREVVGRELVRRGFVLSDSADLILEIRIGSASYYVRPPRSSSAISGLPTPLRETEDGSDDRSPVVHQIQIPTGERSAVSPSVISLELVLFRPGAVPVWSATIRAPLSGDKPEKFVSRLATAAMAAFGETAERDFALDCAGESDIREGLCLP